MLYPENNSYYAQKASIKLNLLIVLFWTISNLILINCEDNPPTFKNNIIIFEHTKFNGGATNKNGDLFIEYYSEENYYDISESIIFYGLSKKDRYCFTNESSYTKRQNIDIYETIDCIGQYNIYEIYDSKNLFVSMKNDYIGEDQYLFSINSYNSIVELHNFNNYSDIKRYIWDFDEFFDLTEEDYYIPCEREIYKLNGFSLYAIAFIPNSIINENFRDKSFIKKFTFKSFDKDAYQELKYIKYDNFINRKIMGTFFMDDFGILASISCKVDENPSMFIFSFFNQNLQFMQGELNLNFNKNLFDINRKDDFYFKPIYLRSKFAILAYESIYCKTDNQWYCFEYSSGIFFELFSINVFSSVTKIKESDPVLTTENILADFTKISDTKLIFINYNTIDNYKSNLNNFHNNLHIKIIKISPDFSSFEYKSLDSFHLGNYLIKMPLSSFMHNGFLLFTSTAFLQEEIDKPEDEINYFSMLMIFGYPNGTDSTINIYDYIYFNDENDEVYFSHEFYKFLFKNYTIENNCINYIADNRIKLISIPEEIIIMEKKENENDENTEIEINELKNNSFMSPENEYILIQNMNLKKKSEYYYIDYQYIAKESESDESEIYYGRINRLKFKLCHDYCQTCFELSKSNNEQKCLSCLPEYQYDYQYFQKINNNELPLNCAPEGYYLEDNILTLCNYEDEKVRYYFNTTSNKKICYKGSLCPSSYPIYNETTKECFYCDFERFKNKECTSDDLTMYSNGYSENCCNDNEKYLDKVITNFQEYIIDNYKSVLFDNDDDFMVLTEKMSYALTTTKNQKMKMDDNITTIDLGKCEIELKNEYNISMNDSLYILKIDILVDNIQNIEYEVYYNFSSNNLTKLDLTVCKDIKIDILIPKDIPINEIDKYNKNSRFYNELCYTFTTNEGTDITLNDRINEYKKNNLFICEDGCEFSEYNIKSKKVICSCFTKIHLPLISEIKVDKEKLYSNFKDIRNIGNFEMLS